MKPIKTPTFWRRLPLTRQLLLAVNSFLLVIVGGFLFVDHRLRVRRAVQQTKVALAEEAKTLYESAAAIEGESTEPIQKLVDSVCGRMNSDDSPGHHIALRWQGEFLQARSHGRASPQMFDAMMAAASGHADLEPMAGSMVVGSFEGPAGQVLVSEKRSNILAIARDALVRQMIAVFLAGSLAAFLVNLVLRKIVTKPIRRLVTSLQSLGDGKLESRVDVHSCRELSYLGEQFNDMAAKLDAAERDRRVHMAKARAIQQNLRPSTQVIPGANIAELFEPADDVGGDYYDVIRLSENSTLLCIADVSGHGVPAAMAATLLKAFVAEAAKQSHHPAEILTRVNQQYHEYVMMGHFATMVLVRIDVAEQRLTYANAGHELPFLQCGDEPVRRLDHSDLILGVEDDTTYEECCLPICIGAKLILVSDGVTEAFNPDEEQFGTERVSNTIAKAIGEHASDLVGRFDSELEAFRNGRAAFDDTTLVVAELVASD